MDSPNSKVVGSTTKSKIDEDQLGILTRSKKKHCLIDSTAESEDTSLDSGRVKTRLFDSSKLSSQVDTRKSLGSSSIKKGNAKEDRTDNEESEHSYEIEDEPTELVTVPKEKATPVRRSRRLSGTENSTEKLKPCSVKIGKMSAVMANIEEVDLSELVTVPKEKATPVRRSRRLSGVENSTEKLKPCSVMLGKMSTVMADIEELDLSEGEKLCTVNDEPKKLVTVQKEKATPIRRSRRLSGVDHESDSSVQEIDVRKKQSNSVRKEKLVVHMVNIEEEDHSEEQPASENQTITIVSSECASESENGSNKAPEERKSLKRKSAINSSEGSDFQNETEKLKSPKKKKVSPEKKLVEGIGLNDDHESMNGTEETPEEVTLTKNKTKSTLEDSICDSENKVEKVKSPQKNKMQYVYEPENSSDKIFKEKKLPKHKSAMNSSDVSDSETEILKESEEKKASHENDDTSESEKMTESTPKGKLQTTIPSSENSNSDSNKKNEELYSPKKKVLAERKLSVSLSPEKSSEDNGKNEKSIRKRKSEKVPIVKLTSIDYINQFKSKNEKIKSPEKKASLSKESIDSESENENRNVKSPSKKNDKQIIDLSEEEVMEISLDVKSTESPSKRKVKYQKVVDLDLDDERMQIMKDGSQEKSVSKFDVSGLSTRMSSPNKGKVVSEISSPVQKSPKKVNKSQTPEKVSPTKHFNNIIEKETISSSEPIQLPSISPMFKNKVREDVKSGSSDSDSDAESRKAIKESAQKRIIQNLSTSESESKKLVKPNVVEEDSDSDSSPDEMSFSTGLRLQKYMLKNAVESINRDKLRKKEIRKQRLEKYKQQKEEKLIRLKEKRASQEDASCSSSEESGYEDESGATVSKSKKKKHVRREKENVDDLPIPKVKKFTRSDDNEDEIGATASKSKKKQQVRQEKENVDDLPKQKIKKFTYSDDDEEIKRKREKKEKKRKREQFNVEAVGNLRKLPADVLENLPDEIPLNLDTDTTSKEKKKKKKLENSKEKNQDFRPRSDIDYIPLSSQSSTQFGVMPLETFARASISNAEKAKEFKQMMLYSRVERGPVNAHIIYRKKMKAAGMKEYY